MSSEIEGPSFTTSVIYWTGLLEARFNVAFARKMRESKTVVSRWRTLSVLAELSGLTISELAEHSFIERSALSRLLTQMEHEGLIERRVRTGDKRTIEVHITEAGRAAFGRMLPVRREIFRDAARGMKRSEIAGLMKSVRSLIDNLEAQAKTAGRKRRSAPGGSSVSQRPSAARRARG